MTGDAMDPAAPRPAAQSRSGTLAVAAVVVAFVAAAAGWSAWQLRQAGPGKEDLARERAFDISQVARPAPPRQLLGQTIDGKPFGLGDLRGQVVFVNFWATWCPPCRDEMPSMLALGRELSRRHPGKFRMVAVSVDDGWPEVLQFFGGALPAGIDVIRDADQEVTRAYYCQARGTCPDSYKFPETYLVDPSGRLVEYVVGPRDWSDPAAMAALERLIR